LVVTLLPFPDSQTAALAERGSALPCQFHAQLESQCAQRAHHRAQRQRASAGQLATHTSTGNLHSRAMARRSSSPAT